MRPLVIACEEGTADELRRAVSLYAHPAATDRFVTFLELASDGDIVVERLKVVNACQQNREGATGNAVVCAIKEIGFALSLRTVLQPYRWEYEQVSKAAFCSTRGDRPWLKSLLARCGLTVRNAAAEWLTGWAHSAIDASKLDHWATQFQRLRLPWLGDALLSSLRIIPPSELGQLLSAGLHSPGSAISVNHDARTHGKSGDVIANLLTKRLCKPGEKVFEAPADAFGAGHHSVTLYEDGLWTGTEAVGVLESLLNERPPERQKTKPLPDPAMFASVRLRLAYGVASNYGQAIVNRFVAERGFTNVEIVSASDLEIASAELVRRIGTGEWPIRQLWEEGPPISELHPQVLSVLHERVGLDSARLHAAHEFCRDVGRQLFENYTLEMRARSKTYRPWPAAKLDKCSLGMWGQGLTIAFGHSIPKAALPLFWGRGKVSHKGREIDWSPLFENGW